MVETLAELFRESSAEEIGKVVYLTQGRVAPLYEPVEFQMAEKSILKTLALAYEVNEEKVSASFKRHFADGFGGHRFTGFKRFDGEKNY